MTDGQAEAQTTGKVQANNINGWDGPHDPKHPRNWSTARKWVITVITSLMTFSVTFASSVFSTAEAPTAEKFHVSHEVMVLGLSLFVLVSSEILVFLRANDDNNLRE